MRALVTGGGGFIGRYVVEQLLARGDAVSVFARGAYPELAVLGARVVRGDLRDRDALARACAGIDVVFHVAARAGLWGPWAAFYETNVLGTRHVIDGCRAAGVRRLVFSSSPSVVFDNRSHAGCDESLPYPGRYESYYPQTKAVAERLVRSANDGRSLLTVSLRPHLVWGPRDTHILPGVIAAARSGRLVQVGDGTNRVDLTYVEDAARAHLLAADALAPGAPAAGAVYFISQDAPQVLWAWLRDFLDRLGLPAPRRRLSLPVARALGGILETAYRVLRLPGEPRLTRFLASELAMDHYYDIGRARRDLGYEPRVGMEEGMRRTLASLRGQVRAGTDASDVQ